MRRVVTVGPIDQEIGSPISCQVGGPNVQSDWPDSLDQRNFRCRQRDSCLAETAASIVEVEHTGVHSSMNRVPTAEHQIGSPVSVQIGKKSAGISKGSLSSNRIRQCCLIKCKAADSIVGQ